MGNDAVPPNPGGTEDDGSQGERHGPGGHDRGHDPGRHDPGRHWPGGHGHGASGVAGRLTRARVPVARSGFLEYDRVLFFSDAVFAIAITLLALELRPPRAGELHATILSLAGFGISFAVIGLFWLGHHGMFRYIVGFDRALVSLNLLFLGTIALLPFPTRLLFSPGSHPGYVIFYAACAAAAGLGEGLVWVYATRIRPELADPSARAIWLHMTLRIARVPVVFLISIPVALVSPQNAPYVWVAIWVVGLLVNRFVPQPDPAEPIGDQIRG